MKKVKEKKLRSLDVLLVYLCKEKCICVRRNATDILERLSEALRK